jgi:hypothetical protein
MKLSQRVIEELTYCHVLKYRCFQYIRIVCIHSNDSETPKVTIYRDISKFV